MRKPFSRLLIAAVLITCMLLSGCSLFKHTEEIEAAATGFLDCLVNGDTTAVTDYSTETVFEENAFTTFNADYLEEDFYASMDLDKSRITEDARKSVREYCELIVHSLLKSYTLTGTSEEKSVGTVTAEVVLGFDPDNIEPAEGSEAYTQMSEAIEAYQNAHLNELIDIYNTQGEEAYYDRFYSDLIPIVLGIYRQQIESSEEIRQVMTLTVEQQEDEGKTWKVTSFTTEPLPDAAEGTAESAPEATTETVPETATEAAPETTTAASGS